MQQEPKDETFRHITCDTLTVTNNDGNKITLSFLDDGRPVFRLHETPNSSGVSIFTARDGGVIAVFGKDGLVRVEIFVDDDGIGHVFSGSEHQRFASS
jgi:hypothetical protein